MSLYQIFYDKLPINWHQVMPDDNPKLVTFLNPSYIEQLKDKSEIYNRFDYICSDGMFVIELQKLWGKNKSERISFDMSSLAAKVFHKAQEKGLSIYFIGSTKEMIGKFINQIKKAYPKLIICGFSNGYIKDKIEETAQNVISYNPDIVVAGMGAPLQDQFLIKLRDIGFKGTGYTCGGFIHQTSDRIQYYPYLIQKLGLRTPYRLVKEPYNWGRVKYYFLFMFNYSKFLLKTKRI